MNRDRIPSTIVGLLVMFAGLCVSVGTAEAQPTTSVTGTVTYTANGGSSPLQQAVVYVIDTGKNPRGCVYIDGACTLGSPTFTDTSGRFIFSSVPTTDNGRIRVLETRAYSRSKILPSGTWEVASGFPSAGYFKDTASAKKAGGTIIENIVANSGTASGDAFAIFDEARLAMEYGSSNGLGLNQLLQITYPASQTQTTNYSVGIALGDALLPDVVNHEMGHVFGDQAHIGTAGGGVHAPGDDLIAKYGETQGVHEAWHEGFADFFAVQVRVNATTLPPRASRAETLFLNGGSAPLYGTNPRAQGEGDELAVARILELAADGYINGLGRLSLATLIRRLSGVHADRLTDAVDELRTEGNLHFGTNDPAQARRADEFGSQLAEQGVGPTVSGPGATTMLDAGMPPIFTWTAGGTVSDKAPLNTFTVYFYDQYWNLIPGATGTADSKNGGSLAGASYNWHPPTTDPIWTALVRFVEPDGTLPTAIHLELEGKGDDGNHPTPSGPYPGQGASTGTFNPTLTATRQGKFLTPPDRICLANGQSTPADSQFALTAEGLQPSTSYKLSFQGTTFGHSLNQPFREVTTDTQGHLPNTVLTLPPMPGGYWSVVATPTTSGYAPKAYLGPGTLSCVAAGQQNGRGAPYIAPGLDGVGLAPQSTYTATVIDVTSGAQTQVVNTTSDAKGSINVAQWSGPCPSGDTEYLQVVGSVWWQTGPLVFPPTWSWTCN